MIDIFKEEQYILEEAVSRIDEVKGGAPFDFADYEKLTKEYGKLLKQLRRTTRISDRTETDLFNSNLDLTDKVHVDALTGIYNRRYMDDNLFRIVNSLTRSAAGQLSVLMIDIDYFKKYNDTYGHDEGDDCLRKVAKAIAGSILHPDDFAARYGGEEFAVILPDTDEEGACNMAQKILENVKALNICHEKNQAAQCVTVSIGVTTGVAENAGSATDYIKSADEALYMSKQNGRNQYTYHDLIV